jgi:hypothetical protein
MPATVRAYDQPVHAFLSKRVYRGPATIPELTPQNQAAVDRLRARVYRFGAEASSVELRKRFLSRYPNAASFDAAAMKRLFMLNPQKPVAGFDQTPLPAGTAAEAYALASRLPDDDQRNRDRVRIGTDGKPVLDRWGRQQPLDPATLEMGPLVGPQSQAHAHYQLPNLKFSDSPEVLKGEPRRFAIPPTVHTFGTELADAYTSLALLAAQDPAGQRLALTFAGAATHHIQDVANQIHTVQVGIYDFFFDAKIESIKEELRSIGGLWRPRPTFVTIGIQIIANHHLLLEELFGRHLLTPGDPVAKMAERERPDAPYAVELARVPRGCTVPFARELMDLLVERSSLEGPAAYTAIRQVALPSLSKVGVEFKDDENPDAFIRPGAELSELYAIQLRGIERADMTVKAWWERYNACTKVNSNVERAIAERMIAARLDSLDAAEARAAAWHPQPPETAKINWWVPGGYAGAVLFILLLIRSRKRRRATSSKQKPPSAPTPKSSDPSASRKDAA